MNVKMGFWLRWAWRDLRARWLQVLAVSVIIALGTGIFSGLFGQRTWRENSYDESYALLNMYDVKVRMANGSFVAYDEVQNLLNNIDGIATYEGRLNTSTLVDVSGASNLDDASLIPGVVIGVDANPDVNGFFIREDAVFDTGRTLEDEDNGTLNANVTFISGRTHTLEPGETLLISGDVTLNVVGSVMTPEYFLVSNPENNNIFSIGNFFPIFVTLETAQDLSGREGLINDVALKIEADADLEQVKSELESQFALAFPDVGITVLDRTDDLIYTQLYEDARADQGTWTSMAILFLLGASFGVFNLAGRLVESQRRQIGIGMALGVPRQWIAFRPLLVGLQIAVIGSILGLLMGIFFSLNYGALLDSITPMPIFNSTLYLPGYIIATLLGIALPMTATLIPVWRAVRVPPIDAIKTGHLVAKGGGMSGILKSLPLPGDSFTQMPFRNILRAPFRTTLTVAGVAMAVILLVLFKGMLDSFLFAINEGEESLVYVNEDRIAVGLDFFYPIDEATQRFVDLTDADGNPIVVSAESQLALGGTLIGDNLEIATTLDLLPMSSTIWTPRLIDGELTGGDSMPGIVISRKSLEDLSLTIGDTVLMEHPIRENAFAFRLMTSEFEIVGVHDNPIRGISYMDYRYADVMGLADTTNSVVLVPTDDADADTFKRILLTQQGVTSVDAVADVSKGLDEFSSLISGFLIVITIVVIIMAFLIAFNTTSINVDERVREIATMFAYGLPIRIVTRMQMIENFVIGVMASAVGVLVGYGLLTIVLDALLESSLETITLEATLAPLTIVLAALVGIVTVTLTPLLSIRKMQRMDIPSELRVME